MSELPFLMRHGSWLWIAIVAVAGIASAVLVQLVRRQRVLRRWKSRKPARASVRYSELATDATVHVVGTLRTPEILGRYLPRGGGPDSHKGPARFALAMEDGELDVSGTGYVDVGARYADSWLVGAPRDCSPGYGACHLLQSGDRVFATGRLVASEDASGVRRFELQAADAAVVLVAAERPRALWARWHRVLVHTFIGAGIALAAIAWIGARALAHAKPLNRADTSFLEPDEACRRGQISCDRWGFEVTAPERMFSEFGSPALASLSPFTRSAVPAYVAHGLAGLAERANSTAMFELAAAAADRAGDCESAVELRTRAGNWAYSLERLPSCDTPLVASIAVRVAVAAGDYSAASDILNTRSLDSESLNQANVRAADEFDVDAIALIHLAADHPERVVPERVVQFGALGALSRSGEASQFATFLADYLRAKMGDESARQRVLLPQAFDAIELLLAMDLLNGGRDELFAAWNDSYRAAHPGVETHFFSSSVTGMWVSADMLVCESGLCADLTNSRLTHFLSHTDHASKAYGPHQSPVTVLAESLFASLLQTGTPDAALGALAIALEQALFEAAMNHAEKAQQWLERARQVEQRSGGFSGITLRGSEWAAQKRTVALQWTEGQVAALVPGGERIRRASAAEVAAHYDQKLASLDAEYQREISNWQRENAGPDQEARWHALLAAGPSQGQPLEFYLFERKSLDAQRKQPHVRIGTALVYECAVSAFAEPAHDWRALEVLGGCPTAWLREHGRAVLERLQQRLPNIGCHPLNQALRFAELARLMADIGEAERAKFWQAHADRHYGVGMRRDWAVLSEAFANWRSCY